MNVNTAEVTQIKASMAELAATAQQTQAKTHMLAQQRSAGPATTDIVQLQHDLRTLEASLQQMQAAQTGADDRWQAVEAAVARLHPADRLEERLSLQVQAKLCASLLCHFLPQDSTSVVSCNFAWSCNDAKTTPSTHTSVKGFSRLAGVLTCDYVLHMSADSCSASCSCGVTLARWHAAWRCIRYPVFSTQGMRAQVNQVDSALTGRLNTVEEHLHLIAGLLGTDLANLPAAQPTTLHTASPHLATGHLQSLPEEGVMQQLSHLHAELSRLSQSQEQASADAQRSSGSSTDIADVRHRLSAQESDVQQLQQAHSDAVQQAAVLQQGLAAQEAFMEEVRQTQHSQAAVMDSMAADLARHINNTQDAQSQLEVQNSSGLSHIREEASQHHEDLSRLQTASARHDEQLQQHSQNVRQLEEQLAHSKVFQREAQETLQRLDGHAEAHSTSVRPSGTLKVLFQNLGLPAQK